MAINEKVGILIQAPGEVRPNPGLIGGNYADYLTKELDFLDDSRNFPLASDFASSPAFNTSAGWTSDANSVYGIWGDLESSYREWLNAYNREMNDYWMSRTWRSPLDVSPGYESVARDPAPWKNDWTGSNALEWIRRTVPSPADGSFNYPYPEFPVFDHHSFYNNRRGLFHRYLRFHQASLEDIYTNHSYRDGSAGYIDQNAPVATNIDEAYQIGSGLNGNANVIRRLANGKIIVAGQNISSYNGTDLTQNGNQVVIFQLNIDGTIDADFTPFSTVQGGVYEMDIDADGKILLAGANLVSSSDTATPLNQSIDIIRLNADGTQDTSFNIGSGAVSQYGAMGFFVKALGNGKILFGGQFDSFNGTSLNTLVRLNSDGSVDDTFSVDFEDASWYFAYIRRGHVYDDGKILVSGEFTNVNGATASGIVRLNANGSIDETFSTGSGFWVNGNINDGVFPTYINGTADMGYGIEVNSEGKIYVAGWFNTFNGTPTTSNFLILNSDGSLDKFLPALTVNSNRNMSYDNAAWRLKLIENDKILVLGTFAYYGGVDVSDSIMVINPDGTVDHTYDFGDGLTFGTPNQAYNYYSAWDAVKIGGTLIVVGNFTGYYSPGVSVSKIVAIKNSPIEHTATFMLQSYLSNKDRMMFLLYESYGRDLSAEEEAELATRRADFLATDHTKNQYSMWSGDKAKQIWEHYCNNGWNGGQYQQDTANSGSIDSYEIWPADTTPAEALGATGSVTYNRLPAVTTSSLLPSTGNAGDVIRVRDWDEMAWDPIRGMWSTALYYRFFEPAFTTERQSRDAKLRADNQVTLAMRPWLFASIYIPAFQITTDGNINSELKAF